MPFCNEGFKEFLRANKVSQPNHLASAADGAAADTVYADYVRELASTQESRLATIESKAGSVVTVSGGLVTLVFAFTAITAEATPHRLPSAAKGWLAAAVVGFILCGLAAVAVAVPRLVRALDPDIMALELWDRWDMAADRPVEKVTATRIAQWAATRKLTQRKAKLLIAAYGAQVVAIACLAVGALLTWLRCQFPGRP